MHRAPTPGPAFGGGVQGISAYRASDHWHYLTYGLSELYSKDSKDPDVSGFGYELTMRVMDAGAEPPAWPFNLLEAIARVQRGGHDFRLGDRLDPGGPIDGASSALTTVAFTLDPELRRTDTVHGHVAFYQVVGVTEAEAAEMRSYPGSEGTPIVLGRLAATNPLLVTDPRRS